MMFLNSHKNMRIISGKYKSHKLYSKNFKGLRPTLDRVKQTIFDILFNYIDIKGKNILDAFAGTGSLGLEALSRHALEAYFVDTSFKAYKLIKKNVKNLGVEESSTLIKNNVYSFFNNFDKKNYFDLIFLDPPYSEEHINLILAKEKFYKICNTNAIVVVEVDKNYDISYNKNWEMIKKRSISNTVVYFLRKVER